MQQTGAPAPVAAPLQDLCSSPNFLEDGLGTVCMGFACRTANLLGEQFLLSSENRSSSQDEHGEGLSPETR